MCSRRSNGDSPMPEAQCRQTLRDDAPLAYLLVVAMPPLEYLLFSLAIPRQVHLEKASHRLSLTPVSSLTLQRTLRLGPALKLKPSYADFMSTFLQYGFLRAELISHRHVHVFPLLVTDTSSIPYNFTNSFHTLHNLIQHLSSPSPQN